MRHHLIIASVAAAFAVTATSAAADVCTAKKLKAVGKLESGLLACQAKVASTGDSSGLDSCRTKTLEKFAQAYAKAGTCGGEESSCVSSSADCETDVTGAMTDTLPSKCIATKRKAAGKLASSTLGCYSKAAKKDVSLDTLCIDKATAKFTTAIAKADEDGACPDGGDPQTLVEDSCVSPAVVVDAGTVSQGCPEPTCDNVDDGSACTDDSCEAGTPVHTPIAEIDDHNACTTDTCISDEGTIDGIYHTPVDANDGNACTIDSCDPESGVSHTPVVIDDGNACTIDTCAEGSGSIFHTPVATDDGDVCTDDSCDPSTGVVSHDPAAIIDDGNACTTDTCSNPEGTADPVTHTPINPDDDNPCTIDSCDSETGVSHTPVNTDDGDACTVDSCVPGSGSSGGITHEPVDTDDGNPCTDDSCDSNAGVTHTYNGNDANCPMGQVCSPTGCVQN